MDPLRFLRVHRVIVFIVDQAVGAFRPVVVYEIGSIVGHSVQQKKTPDILVDAGRGSGGGASSRGGQAPCDQSYRRDATVRH
jgi:hypothetical protein